HCLLPVTRMIQSSWADTSLRKHRRPSMINFSNDAPDFASLECAGTRSVAPRSRACSDGAVQGRSWLTSTRPFLQIGPWQEIWPSLLGACECLFATPRDDLLVVPAQQNVGYAQPAPDGGLGIDRTLEQPRVLDAVRPLDQRFGIADHSRQQPNHGFDEDHGRDLTATEHVVADAHFIPPHPTPRILDNPSVDSLVSTTGKDQLSLPRKFVRESLVEGPTGR